jgi:TetR/AcrR family transcriptional regulator
MPRCNYQIDRLRSVTGTRPDAIDPAFGATARPKPPPKRRRNKEPMDIRRAKMRETGAKLMAQHGLGNIALPDVARACGIPRGSAYYYYNGWEELLADVIDQHLIELHERIGKADDAHATDPPEQRLIAIADAYMATIAEREAEHRVQFVALHMLPPAVAEALKLKHRWLAARIGECLVAALPELETRLDLLVPATMSLLNLAGGSVLWLKDGGALSRAGYARMLALMVLAGAQRTLATTAVPAIAPTPAS